MNENIKWTVAAIAVVGLSVGAVLYFSPKKTPVADKPAVELPPPPAVAEEPAIKHPLPEPDAAAALPSLDDSSPSVQAALSSLVGQMAVEKFVVPEDLVRHIVVTVDNLPEQKLAERVRPLKRVAGELQVAGTEEQPTLDPGNYSRYETLVQLLRNVETPRLLATYQQYYPLFQEAYANLGHPPQYFNDRVVEVIDHLLATPEVTGPIALQRPGVLYEFADPKLEALSAGQKVLIRMGAQNAAVVKAKLRELRAALASAPKPA